MLLAVAPQSRLLPGGRVSELPASPPPSPGGLHSLDRARCRSEQETESGFNFHFLLSYRDSRTVTRSPALPSLGRQEASSGRTLGGQDLRANPCASAGRGCQLSGRLCILPS
ncbi:unnamed protein product [Caretta caretta]